MDRDILILVGFGIDVNGKNQKRKAETNFGIKNRRDCFLNQKSVITMKLFWVDGREIMKDGNYKFNPPITNTKLLVMSRIRLLPRSFVNSGA